MAAYFSRAKTRVLRPKQLTSLLQENRRTWPLPADLSDGGVIDAVLKSTDLKEVTLDAENDYRDVRRYVWGRVSEYEVALSLRPEAYLSHATAMFLHGLSDRRPNTIYVNQEQSAKPKRDAVLTQEGITRAFAATQRQSKYSFRHNDTRIVVVSGKNSKRLEVALLPTQEGRDVPATGLERTLIDITVRPAYTGGVRNVMRAYELAKGRLSGPKLLETLLRLDHTYPYDQALGFYLERAGHPERDVSPFRKKRFRFDFFASHGLKDPAYDRRWRLYYPREV
jgi:predicted transcriptional regulator of viral defense system